MRNSSPAPGYGVRNNDKGLDRKSLLPLLVGDASVPQRCMLRRVTPLVFVLPSEKLFPVMHPGMEHGIMARVWRANDQTMIGNTLEYCRIFVGHNLSETCLYLRDVCCDT